MAELFINRMTSNFATRQYTSSEFVESAGAILFDLTASASKKVCLIHYLAKDEYFFAKGRRNCGETRHEAALREVREETGYKCQLLPVTMPTRAPPVVEVGDTPDEPRVYRSICEPFMLTVRDMQGSKAGSKQDVKLIWWYIAVVEERGKNSSVSQGESQFTAEFFPFDEALEKLTFSNDRDLLKRAIELVENSLDGN